jgi:hypothetical protein
MTTTTLSEVEVAVRAALTEGKAKEFVRVGGDLRELHREFGELPLKPEWARGVRAWAHQVLDLVADPGPGMKACPSTGTALDAAVSAYWDAHLEKSPDLGDLRQKVVEAIGAADFSVSTRDALEVLAAWDDPIVAEAAQAAL